MNNVILRADENLIYTIKNRVSNLDKGELIEENGYIIFSIGVSTIDGHLSGGICMDDSKAEDFVEHIFRFFKERGFGFSIWVKDHGNVNLESILKSRGLSPAREKGSPIMVCNKVIDIKPLHEDFYMKKITSNEIEDFKKIIINAFDKEENVADAMISERIVNHPDWDGILIYEKSTNKPVATGAVVNNGDTAGIYYIATLEEYRGKGLGQFVASETTNMGFNKGANLVVLQASSLGESVYVKINYNTVSYYRGYRVEEKILQNS
ncbi:MAG: hypothetical protein RSA01_08500 [Clostridium sp.]|uniref:GNAT family N-acetyltransferase n=1 Tax=Clostridium sp. TaxID=1506 RepID=UPI002FC8E03E